MCVVTICYDGKSSVSVKGKPLFKRGGRGKEEEKSKS